MPQQTPVTVGELKVRVGVGQAASAEMRAGHSARLALTRHPMHPSKPLSSVGGEKPVLQAIVSSGLAGQGLRWIVASAILAILIGEATLSAWPGRDSANSLPLQQAVTRALDEDAASSRGRLVSARLTSGGDAIVEVVLRDLGDVQANRAAALADTLTIARALYQAPEPRPVNLTVLGLAWRPSGGAGYMPVLYASLPADQLVGRDWAQIRPDDLPSLVGVRWLPTGVCQAWHECGAASG